MDPPPPTLHPYVPQEGGRADEARSKMADWDGDDIGISFGSFSVEETVESNDESHVRICGAPLFVFRQPPVLRGRLNLEQGQPDANSL